MNEHAIQIMFYTSMGTMMLALAFLVWGWHLHDRAFTIHGTSWSRSAPAAAGAKIKRAAPSAGATRRACAIGKSEGIPNSAGSAAASTVTKLSP